MAYQIIDDSLDYFSDFKTSGKSSGNDLKEGKMSLPLILCYKRCDKIEKKIIELIITKDKINNSDFLKIKNLMTKYDIRQACVKKARHFSTMAMDSLGIFSDSAEKEKLVNLVDYLTYRTK